VPKAKTLGYEVEVAAGAGAAAGFADSAYQEAGANLVGSAAAGSGAGAIGKAQVIASVSPLEASLASQLAPGAVTISFLQKERDEATISAIMQAKANALSFDYLPRISRAQAADALTSQAIVSGYRVTLVAAGLLPKFFPLYMTAAGTIRPAKVLVLGAGVAGLQAMATAKKLGAVVSGYDVRAASPDEVKSVGARFVNIDLPPIDGAGGYARELGEERAKKQQELLTPVIAEQNIVITTAAVPGRPAPRLVTNSMLTGMAQGSVVCDLAAESGGNVEGSVAGEVINIAGVTLWGGKDVPSQMAPDASSLYSGNIVAMLGFITKDGALHLDKEDEVVRESAVVLSS
jgi:NAD(P) transhydrogenase subunit alpha